MPARPPATPLPTDAAPELKSRVRQKKFTDSALFTRLSNLRRAIAAEQNVPPFVIFTNATLRDMAQKAPRTRAQMLRDGKITVPELFNDAGEFMTLDELRRVDASAFE